MGEMYGFWLNKKNVYIFLIFVRGWIDELPEEAGDP